MLESFEYETEFVESGVLRRSDCADVGWSCDISEWRRFYSGLKCLLCCVGPLIINSSAAALGFSTALAILDT